MKSEVEAGASTTGVHEMLDKDLVEAEVAHADAAIFLGGREAEKTVRAGFGEELARNDPGAIPSFVVRRDFLPREVTYQFAEGEMIVRLVDALHGTLRGEAKRWPTTRRRCESAAFGAVGGQG